MRGWVPGVLLLALSVPAGCGGGPQPDATPRDGGCTPRCEGRICGDDGCGGSCGGCSAGRQCSVDGACVQECVSDCGARVCGLDRCGRSCGTCSGGTTCNAQGTACVSTCEPSCTGKVCGSDGCQGSCGTCPPGSTCSGGGTACVPDCRPDCAGKACGDDGCGGSCGGCPSGRACDPDRRVCESTCTPSCSGRECGDDGCGGSCGPCPDGEVCQPSTGRCAACTPSCAGRACGSDGCGGTCGQCGGGASCRDTDGRCVAACVPRCEARTCGPDGCGGACGFCEQSLLCEAGGCAAPAFPAVDWCRFQWPVDAKAAPLAQVAAYVRLFEAGITNRTGACDPDPSVRVEAGVGPLGGDPAGAMWTWTAATPNPGWTDGEEPGNDEYMATIAAPPVTGRYDLAFRVSLDAGAHWVYCDRSAGYAHDGSEDGYQVALAAHLEVSPGCAPNCPAVCGNGVVEAGESCDGDCPRACDDGSACTRDLLVGSASGCDAACRFEPITRCAGGDGCCPAGCGSDGDSDCPTTCGNGRLDAGETCDGSCPAACDDANECTVDTLVGSPARCTAACSFESIRSCRGGDGCCPAGCNRATDPDCSPTCGDGLVDPGEACDGNCPASCDDGNACTIDQRTGSAATCSVACSRQSITACRHADGCCPAGCNRATDDDCSASCGDAIHDPGETCDGDCPASCDDANACTVDAFTGSAATCSLACRHQSITTCRGGDGCCPAGCNALLDGDCSPSCGNGAVERGETCDGNCPAGCADADACTVDAFTGSARTCSLACTHARITQCVDGDGCCPAGCDALRDTDCEAVCGNAVVEPGERCDGNCPASCDDADACTVDSAAGSASRCNLACAHRPLSCPPAPDTCDGAYTLVSHSAACSPATGQCVPAEQRRDCGRTRLLRCDAGRCSLCLDEGGWNFDAQSANHGEQAVYPFETGGPTSVSFDLQLLSPVDEAQGYSQLVALSVQDVGGRTLATSRWIWDTNNTQLYSPCAGAESTCDRGDATFTFNAPARGGYRLVVSVINARRRVSVPFGFTWENYWLRYNLAMRGALVVDAALWERAVISTAGVLDELPVPDGEAAGVEAVADVVPCRPFTLRRGTANVYVRSAQTPAQLKVVLTHDGVEAVLWDHQAPPGGTFDVSVPLSAFVGHPAGGPWRLRVVDDTAGGGSAGTLSHFGLDLRAW